MAGALKFKFPLEKPHVLISEIWEIKERLNKHVFILLHTFVTQKLPLRTFHCFSFPSS